MLVVEPQVCPRVSRCTALLQCDPMTYEWRLRDQEPRSSSYTNLVFESHACSPTCCCCGARHTIHSATSHRGERHRTRQVRAISATAASCGIRTVISDIDLCQQLSSQILADFCTSISTTVHSHLVSVSLFSISTRANSSSMRFITLSSALFLFVSTTAELATHSGSTIDPATSTSTSTSSGLPSSMSTVSDSSLDYLATSEYNNTTTGAVVKVNNFLCRSRANWSPACSCKYSFPNFYCDYGQTSGATTGYRVGAGFVAAGVAVALLGV